MGQLIRRDNYDPNVIEIADNGVAKEINNVGTDESIEVKSKRFTQYIIKYIVQPLFISDLNYHSVYRFKYRQAGNIFYILAKIIALLAAAVGVVETFLKTGYLAIVFSCVNLTAVFCLQMRDFLMKESNKCTNALNHTLKDLQIQGIPEMDDSHNHDHQKPSVQSKEDDILEEKEIRKKQSEEKSTVSKINFSTNNDSVKLLEYEPRST